MNGRIVSLLLITVILLSTVPMMVSASPHRQVLVCYKYSGISADGKIGFTTTICDYELELGRRER